MVKKFILVAFLILVITAGAASYIYQMVFGPNIATGISQTHIDIPTGSSFEDVMELLTTDSLINNLTSLRWVAKKMNYVRDKIPSGRYPIEPGWSNRDLIRTLRSGVQVPVILTFNNCRTIFDLASVLDKQLELDSLSFLAAISDSTVQHLGLTMDNRLSLFIPNSYEIYWDISPQAFIHRMAREHDQFWTADRKQKAEALGMTPSEVYTLASIVQKETLLEEEKRRVAGVYLNRLRKNILLQADPTVVFAVGDFELRRVLNKHLEIDSPYNTYKYPGLPPGPIYMPDISTIDAVLSAEKHNYLYFCADPDNIGGHLFAKTLAQHNVNANRYQRWLSRQGIYK